ncbi:MAG: hypothetical protein QY326_07680 [Bdellovibrionota bacterium]|nr:MAG: hypothetical protein QY326_07680 [Bdellovibrionota bacterium]
MTENPEILGGLTVLSFDLWARPLMVAPLLAVVALAETALLRIWSRGVPLIRLYIRCCMVSAGSYALASVLAGIGLAAVLSGPSITRDAEFTLNIVVMYSLFALPLAVVVVRVLIISRFASAFGVVGRAKRAAFLSGAGGLVVLALLGSPLSIHSASAGFKIPSVVVQPSAGHADNLLEESQL